MITSPRIANTLATLPELSIGTGRAPQRPARPCRAAKLGYGIHELKEWMVYATVNTTIDLYGKWVRGDEDSRRAKDDAAFLSVQPAAPVVPLRSGRRATNGFGGRGS